MSLVACLALEMFEGTLAGSALDLCYAAAQRFRQTRPLPPSNCDLLGPHLLYFQSHPKFIRSSSILLLCLL